MIYFVIVKFKKMKNFTIPVALLLLILSGCGTSRRATDATSHATAAGTEVQAVAETAASPAVTDYHDATTWLLGYFNPSRMKQDPHAVWYINGYDDYMPKTDVLNSLLEIPVDGLSIKIVMGTWCPDSRREVPRFMKILDLWQFPAGKVTFVGVDEAKLAPVGDYTSLNIDRVPTFIIYKNNSEAGRIIEVPKTSLEQDMVNILSGNK